MTDDPSKSIRSIAKNMTEYEFFIKQVSMKTHFSYKMREGQFLSLAIKDKKKDCIANLLKKLKNPL